MLATFLSRPGMLSFCLMSQSPIKSVYVLHGKDAFLRDAARSEIVRQIIGDSDPQVAVSTFEADAELAVVLDELRTMPFLAPRRAVIVRDADVFITEYREALDKYLQSPSANSSLILMVTGWLPKSNLGKLVAKIGEVINCTPPDEANLPNFIRDAAQKRSKKIRTDAAQLLQAWIGPDLAAIDSEMEKLSIYIGERAEINVDDVSRLVTSSAGPEAFALTNAITAGDVSAALKALGGMINQRGDEFKALGMVVWHLRRVLSAQQNIAAGTPVNRALPNMPYSAQGPFIAMLKRRPLKKLQQDFRRLIATDLAMKSGAKPQAALTDLVVQLCI